ncbi:MAG TPA: Ig-like domain-containing protein, partial [Conexibacter sp.]|nr:Ig-like domain-containing protein [Conexibacter sp.]
EATRSFTVDTAPPSLSIDSGPSGPTRDPAPSFAFTAEPGATAECSIDHGTAAYGPCTGTGTDAALAALPDGSYAFHVRATDAAGNQTATSQSFVVDTAPPSLSIDSGPAGLTNDATPSFQFSAEAGATVACSIDHGTAAYGPCTGTGTVAALAALPDGSYAFHLRATDAAGNQTETSQSFVVDATPPAVGVTAGPSGPTNDATPAFQFSAEGGTTVECSVDHGSPAYGPCTTASSYTVASPLTDGSYHFRVRATDAAGNRATAAQDFSVDSAAPSLSIDSGPAGTTNDATPSFGFTAEADTTVTCSIDHGTPAYGPCTSATTDVAGAALPDGTYTFHVKATKDDVGNTASVSRTFTVDTTPPSLSIDFGPSGTTSDSTPLFGFTAERDATVACSIDHGTPAYGPCASATTHAADAPLADGAYVFHARATDAAGNQTTVTRAFTVATGAQTNPAPPPTVSTPVGKPAATPPKLLSPFPLVRIAGSLTRTGAHVRLLSVHAPRGALVRITVSPSCSKKRRSAHRCRVLESAATVRRGEAVAFKALERSYHSGTVIVVRVWSTGRIGKYTRFTIMHGKPPRRVDQCLAPGASRGSRCPSA